MSKLTPMMQQYLEIKKNYQESLLFFRLGDFYEMFYEDALIAVETLDITLTGKQCGLEERVPMCGVPFHSAETYISRLISAGFRVAICEQVEDAKNATGIVKREVVRVVSAGTTMDETIVPPTKNNYIIGIFANSLGYGLATCDVTTGEFHTTEFASLSDGNKLFDEIVRIRPAEIICNESFKKSPLAKEIEQKLHYFLNDIDDRIFEIETAKKQIYAHYKVATLDGFGITKQVFAVAATGGLLWYLAETQKNGLEHISNLSYYEITDFMMIDAASRRNLELTETIREKSKRGALISVLDETRTAMGARLLRKWLEQPLLSVAEIKKRLDAVEELKTQFMLREELKEVLSTMRDFERIMGRIIYQTANARDLNSLKASIADLPKLKTLLSSCNSAYLKEIHGQLDDLENIYTLIDVGIVEKPPLTIREGGMIKKGFHAELDTYLNAKTEGGKWIKDLAEREREKTNIKNLKIGENRVFGYYIEVTKSNLKDVPERYIRKQTLANCERYITDELKELEVVVLGAEEKILVLESEIFSQFIQAIAKEVERIQYAAYMVSIIDVLYSLSEVAEKMNYKKPTIDDKDVVQITGGRHPVVEKLMKDHFVPNDCYLDTKETQLAVITGPNMAGKSTYMRQVALIVLMAQIGSFVPVESAHIGIVDRIFTRVGAADDLSSGQSTFMVEMAEVALILNNATKNSLLILDEIGRGTSTFDGLSIARAVLEFIVDKKLIGAKTLFATHYHELSELEGELLGVKNYRVDVEEKKDGILFLRTISRGGTSHSYGVEVAKLAGLPEKVIARSKEILKELEETNDSKRIATDVATKKEKPSAEIGVIQQVLPELIEEAKKEEPDLKMVQKMAILKEIEEMEIMMMSPMAGLEKLFDLQKQLKILE
ncbi:MAG: DNA mismatch repair protein MutS [Bacillota bacterium]